MKAISTPVRFLCLLSLIPIVLWQANGADREAESSVPPVIGKGLQLLKSAGPGAAFESWREGGLLEEDPEAAQEMSKFKELLRPLRRHQSYEVVEVREVGRNSRILFVSMTFERGVLFGSFLVWRSDAEWIVQHMEFNTRPEIIMPWLTLSPGP